MCQFIFNCHDFFHIQATQDQLYLDHLDPPVKNPGEVVKHVCSYKSYY